MTFSSKGEIRMEKENQQSLHVYQATSWWGEKKATSYCSSFNELREFATYNESKKKNKKIKKIKKINLVVISNVEKLPGVLM